MTNTLKNLTLSCKKIPTTLKSGLNFVNFILKKDSILEPCSVCKKSFLTILKMIITLLNLLSFMSLLVERTMLRMQSNIILTLSPDLLKIWEHFGDFIEFFKLKVIKSSHNMLNLKRYFFNLCKLCSDTINNQYSKRNPNLKIHVAFWFLLLSVS